MHKKHYGLLIAFAVAVADQISKLYIAGSMELFQSVPVIKGIFNLTYITNTGTAFGLFTEYEKLLLGFGIIAGIGITVYMIKFGIVMPRWDYIALSLILGGAWGNLVDRLLRGAVVDFLDFQIWPIFNLADSAITVGVCILFFATVLTSHLKRRVNSE